LNPVFPAANGAPSANITSKSLDVLFCGVPIDILKVDVEGYEEVVLNGAAQILRDPARAPRFISVELHPFAWCDGRVVYERIRSLLEHAGYSLRIEGLPEGADFSGGHYHCVLFATAASPRISS
jgi:hypothetical protein